MDAVTEGRGSEDLAPTPVHIEARDICVQRGSRTVFDRLCCGFPRGKISVIAGASGAGKTTLLRMVACLLRPTSGEIWVDWEQELTGMSDAEVARYRGHVGMLFQRGALLDAMSLYENVALPLREHSDKSEDEIRREVHQVFDAVGLEGVDELLPGELSGGMVKRAGLARALIGRPDILLCDEPFSGLDPPTVRRVEALLKRVNRRVGATMLVTSHHTKSTLRMADHLVMLLDGRALQGTPQELLDGDEWRVRDFFSEPDQVQQDLEP
ncbi:MAG: ATP-binding cassette domain-containing protein [Myxococcota bacterium]|nr:ATP-binding cassette domain-containing protein [Myxococcota bacterium]